MITQKAFNFLKNVWSLQFNKLASRKINIKKSILIGFRYENMSSIFKCPYQEIEAKKETIELH